MIEKGWNWLHVISEWRRQSRMDYLRRHIKYLECERERSEGEIMDLMSQRVIEKMRRAGL